jgi:hypothetical protein
MRLGEQALDWKRSWKRGWLKEAQRKGAGLIVHSRWVGGREKRQADMPPLPGASALRECGWMNPRIQ